MPMRGVKHPPRKPLEGWGERNAQRSSWECARHDDRPGVKVPWGRR